MNYKFCDTKEVIMRRFFAFVGGLILICCLTGNLFAGEIHEAAKDGDLEKVKAIVMADRSRLTAQDKFGYTALNWAATRAKWDVVRYLVDAGADVNALGTDGCTSLHCAAMHSNVAIVGLLIKRGAIVDRKNVWGNTPLHMACQAGNERVATILIFQGADLNAVSSEGWTPLHYAQMSGHTELATNLKKRKASSEIKDSFGKTADEYKFRRPDPIEIDPTKLEDYTGKYSLGGGFLSKVWIEDDKLWVQDYAHHPTYPIGVDSFFCEKQPWTISFTRNGNGEIDSIYFAFLRRTVGGVKVADDFEFVDAKPKFGLATRPLLKTELSYSTLKDIYRLESVSDTVAAYVTFVLENTPADRAGIRQGDIILTFNNVKIMNSDKLHKIVGEVEEGAKVPVEILRRGNINNLIVNFE